MNTPLSKIIILDQAVVDQIAAGEVIERPASVIKELIENSLDAGVSRIEVEVKDGGKKLIRVSDNGCGMNAEEARLSVQPHATSKIKAAADLFCVRTLGFRGEALSSIVAVSHFEMLTKDSEDLSRPGFFLKLSSGTVLESSEKPASRGTTVWVRELFYNLPVRKKFLRKDLTELSYINEFVDKFILAHPAVAFELIVNGTTVLKTSGRGDLLENLVALYGSEIAEDLKKIQGGGGVKISGVATFRKSWLNRRRQFLLVNGRPIKSGFLNRAIDEAYRGILPKGRFPLIVAFLEIPPDEVDVNIHPQKSEVKFLKPAQVLEAFSAALAGALKTLPGSVTAASQEGEGSGLAEASIYQAESFWEKLADFSLTEDENYKAFQFAETYLVLIHDGKIALVDQHAASERINYEKLLASVGAGPAEAQQKLLTPVTLEISHSEANFLRENLAVLAELGFEIEPFGGGTFLLRAVPVFLFDRKPVEVLEKVCQEIKEVSLSSGLQKSREEIAALVACHSAVRAGDILNPVQIQELLGEFFKTANYQTCPHGRPTLIYLTKEELEKKFFRK